MENINIEALNNLIVLYQVVGIFLIILSCCVIIFILLKFLEWGYSSLNEYCEKSDKELIRETIKEIKENEKE